MNILALAWDVILGFSIGKAANYYVSPDLSSPSSVIRTIIASSSRASWDSTGKVVQAAFIIGGIIVIGTGIFPPGLSLGVDGILVPSLVLHLAYIADFTGTRKFYSETEIARRWVAVIGFLVMGVVLHLTNMDELAIGVINLPGALLKLRSELTCQGKTSTKVDSQVADLNMGEVCLGIMGGLWVVPFNTTPTTTASRHVINILMLAHKQPGLLGIVLLLVSLGIIMAKFNMNVSGIQVLSARWFRVMVSGGSILALVAYMVTSNTYALPMLVVVTIVGLGLRKLSSGEDRGEMLTLSGGILTGLIGSL